MARWIFQLFGYDRTLSLVNELYWDAHRPQNAWIWICRVSVWSTAGDKWILQGVLSGKAYAKSSFALKLCEATERLLMERFTEKENITITDLTALQHDPVLQSTVLRWSPQRALHTDPTALQHDSVLQSTVPRRSPQRALHTKSPPPHCTSTWPSLAINST